MTVVALADVAEVNPRVTERPRAEESVAFVPMAALDSVAATTSGGETRSFSDVSKGYTIFRDRDVLVAKITPCFENNKIGQARLSHPIGVGSSEFHVVRPNLDLLDDRYLLHFLRQDRVRVEGERRMTGSGGQRRVPPAFLKELRLPLPRLEEQRRIAAVLDQADALRARHRRGLLQLDSLAEATYESCIAGVAATYPVRAFAALVASTQIGLVRAAAAQGPERDHDYLRMDAITRTGRLDLSSVTRVDASAGEVDKYSVQDGDLLFNTRNTRELVGKSAVYRGEPRLYNNNLMRIRFNGQVLPDYVHRYLWSPPGQRQLAKRKAGTTSVFAIYAKSLATVEIPVPPFERQREFAESVAQIHCLREKMTAAMDTADELFMSLEARAFPRVSPAGA